MSLIDLRNDDALFQSRLRRNEPVANVSASDSDAGQRELKERAAVQASRYGLGPRRTSHMYREWSKIDTGSDPKPVQGQCTDHRYTDEGMIASTCYNVASLLHQCTCTVSSRAKLYHLFSNQSLPLSLCLYSLNSSQMGAVGDSLCFFNSTSSGFVFSS